MIDKREVGGIRLKKKYWIGSLLSALVIVGAIMMVQPSLALFTSQDTEINNFETGDVDITIIEKDENNEPFNGCTITASSKKCIKKVTIQNITSKTNAVIRVAIVPYWVEYVKDEDGNNLTTPWPGDVSGVTLNFGEPTSHNRFNANLVTISSKNVGWVDGKDGYYYYNRLVPAGDSTRELLSSVIVNVPSELQDRYKGKVLIVDVKSEAVQPTMTAVESLWPNSPLEIRNMISRMAGIEL